MLQSFYAATTHVTVISENIFLGVLYYRGISVPAHTEQLHALFTYCTWTHTYNCLLPIAPIKVCVCVCDVWYMYSMCVHSAAHTPYSLGHCFATRHTPRAMSPICMEAIKTTSIDSC